MIQDAKGLEPKNESLCVTLDPKFQVRPLTFILALNDRKLSIDCDIFLFGKFTLCLSVENCHRNCIFVIIFAST